MRFQPERAEGVNVISRNEPGRLWVGTTPFERSVLVPWQGEVLAWGVSAAPDLEAAHFESVLALEPELVIFGSGARQQFLRPALLRPLIERGIGVETMNTPAACRTYNVLAAEGRRVVAALIVAA